jgi:hypothetical protein
VPGRFTGTNLLDRPAAKVMVARFPMLASGRVRLVVSFSPRQEEAQHSAAQSRRLRGPGTLMLAD